MSPRLSPAQNAAASVGPGSAKEHRTVSRVTAILEMVAGVGQGVRLNDLAGMLEAPKSSVHGLVRGLVATGYLVEGDGVYLLGPAVEALIKPSRSVLAEAARPAMKHVERTFGETVALCSLVGQSVVYVELVESAQPIRYSAPLWERRPLYPTSAGKCFLAHFSEESLTSYLETFETHRREAIRQELADVRRDGVAYNVGETVQNVAAVASPILVRGLPAACINIAGPMDRFSGRLTEAAAVLRSATSLVAENLA